MNVFYAVLGEPLILKDDKIKRYNGTLEGFLYLWILSRNDAIKKLYVSTNDWDKLNTIEKINIDPMHKVVPIKKRDLCTELKNIKIDFGIVKGGYGWARINNRKTVWKNETEYYTPLQMQENYGGPIINYLNMSNIPWVLLINDPRTIHAKRVPRFDTINMPIEIMSQINYNLEFAHLKDYAPSYAEQEILIDVVPVRYRRLEPITSIFYYKNIIPTVKDIKLTMPMMQDVSSNNKKSRRFELLKEWILKYDTDCKVDIYGRWDDYYTAQYKQFKGFLTDYKELDDIMRRTRYTYVIGIGENWSTGKWAEALALEVVPFIAPDYDTQYNAIPKDSWIRVNTPEELYKKMQYLEDNPEERLNLIKKLKEELFKDVKDGVYLYAEINKAVKPLGFKLLEEQTTNVIRKTNALF